MNIAQAKRHVRDTIETYLACDADGVPLIEPSAQRPLFLIGAPGIGKTAIMSQVANELDIGLVSYSMTHHTRQSALGLPFIVHRDYEGFEYEASEYTMSEIVASIYDYMEETGYKHGILFLDEINCVSETLYPSMLQFLQFKTFGRHQVPEGWVVACAGNPPEYNKSVHEFDVVIMDRLRKLEVEAELDVWRNYAREVGVHPAILTFLDAKKEYFYRVESTPAGKIFVTARGWDDLSRAIKACEALDKEVDLEMVGQFVQDAEIAEAFTLYYDLFQKYRSDYQVAAILDGTAPTEIFERAAAAPFDERFALLSLILDTLSQDSAAVLQQDKVLTRLRDILRAAKPEVIEGAEIEPYLVASVEELEKERRRMMSAKTSSTANVRVNAKVTDMVKDLQRAVKLSGEEAGPEAFDVVHQEFRGHVGAFEQQVKELGRNYENAFAFIEQAFEGDRELVVFMTELSATPSTARYIGKYGCESYYRHNSEMLIDEHRRDLISRIDAASDALTIDVQQSADEREAIKYIDTTTNAPTERALNLMGKKKQEGIDEYGVLAVNDAEPRPQDKQAAQIRPAGQPKQEKTLEGFDMMAAKDAGVVDKFHVREMPEETRTSAPKQAAPAGASTIDFATQDQLKEHYDAQSFEYGYASLCHMALPPGLEGKTVVDLGCRRGKGVFKIASRIGDAGRVIGIEWAPEFVNEARQRSDRAAAEAGLSHNNMEFHLGYPEDLTTAGIGNNTVDLVFTNSVLHLTYDPKAVVFEMARVLKHGGNAVFEIALADAPRDPEVVAEARKIGNSIQSAPYVEDFKAWLEEAGLEIVKTASDHAVQAKEGFKRDYEVPVIEAEPEMTYTATVITAAKK